MVTFSLLILEQLLWHSLILLLGLDSLKNAFSLSLVRAYYIILYLYGFLLFISILIFMGECLIITRNCLLLLSLQRPLLSTKLM